MTCLIKSEWRAQLKTLRAQIPSPRRCQAQADAEITLLKKLRCCSVVASYASFNDELDLWNLNRQLAAEGRLLLPRVEGKALVFYKISCLESQLMRSSWGILEPDPACSRRANIEQVEWLLVPAVAFDREKHRLGYGQGFYDRLLASSAIEINTIGVGFQEQLCDQLLPHDHHDIPLKNLYLF